MSEKLLATGNGGSSPNLMSQSTRQVAIRRDLFLDRTCVIPIIKNKGTVAFSVSVPQSVRPNIDTEFHCQVESSFCAGEEVTWLREATTAVGLYFRRS